MTDLEVASTTVPMEGFTTVPAVAPMMALVAVFTMVLVEGYTMVLGVGCMMVPEVASTTVPVEGFTTVLGAGCMTVLEAASTMALVAVCTMGHPASRIAAIFHRGQYLFERLSNAVYSI